MRAVWRTIRDFVFWSYQRGTPQYDVMVALILAFVFIAPLFINFRDKPVERNPHQIRVVVETQGKEFVYHIGAAAVQGNGDAAIRADLLRVIEPIAGEVELLRYEALRDEHGRPVTYIAWVRKY